MKKSSIEFESNSSFEDFYQVKLELDYVSIRLNYSQADELRGPIILRKS